MNSKRAQLIRRQVAKYCSDTNRNDEFKFLYRRAKKHYLRTGNMPLDGLKDKKYQN